RHGENGVRVWGEVPDVRPFLKSADLVVAPLLIARGVQNKVLEAMAMARPVVLTPGAATGIEARDG
ncbi:MAG TPA: glycosyl transferase family 1, partial [Erythrobacter sp.]|nr:glycosyl transferase family 1 [Erythrobacter sp.]